MGWQLVICLCCVLYVVHLSCSAAVDWQTREDHHVDDDDDQLSDDVEPRRLDDSTTAAAAAWLTRHRHARRRHRISQLDRASLSVRRSRRRMKSDDVARRGRGGEGGGRGWRRRADTASLHEATTTTAHQHSWTSTQPLTSHAVHLVTVRPEVTKVTEDSVSDVLMATLSDDVEDGDMLMILVPSNGTVMTSADIHQRALNACRSTQCPRYKVCLLNIQGLPMCRCPSVYHCRGLERRPVCTVDGRSYRNKCFLRVDECAANRRLRVRHRGPCRAGAGRRSFDTGVSSARRQRPRHRQLESSVDEVHVRRRLRRRRPRHKPVTGTGHRHHPRTSRH